MENPILIHLLFVSPRIGTDAKESGVWNIKLSAVYPVRLGSKVKGEWKEHTGILQEIDTLRAIQQHPKGMPGGFCHLRHHLTTGSAGSDRTGGKAFPVMSRNRQRVKGKFRMCGMRIKHCRPFGTQSRRISCILLVVSLDDYPVSQTQGCSYRERGIGSIAARSCLTGGTHQLQIGNSQILFRQHLDGTNDF